MSNEPEGPAPAPDPYAVPDPAPTAPIAPSGYEATTGPAPAPAPTLGTHGALRRSDGSVRSAERALRWA